MGFALAASSCAPPGGAATTSQTGTLLAVVVDQPTGTPLGGTLASVRPASEPLGSGRKFSPIDTAGFLIVDGLIFGRYAVHLKRIGYFQKDTVLIVSPRSIKALIALQRDTLTLR